MSPLEKEYSKKLRKILEQYNDRTENFVADTTIVQLVDFAGELVNDEKNANKLGISLSGADMPSEKMMFLIF